MLIKPISNLEIQKILGVPKSTWHTWDKEKRENIIIGLHVEEMFDENFLLLKYSHNKDCKNKRKNLEFLGKVGKKYLNEKTINMILRKKNG